jgi:DNA primase
MTDLAGFVDEVKEKVDMLEVIEALSLPKITFETKRTGQYIYAVHPDSFAVNPDWGIYIYFAQAGTGGHKWETGDIFHWLERYANMDFMQACEYLSAKTGIRMPEKKAADPENAKRHKERLEVYELAAAWFEKELWNTPALDYCHRRGLTDETIQRARLGFASKQRIQDLRGELSMNNVNLDDPATVGILGKRSGIAAWAEQYHVENAAKWIENDYVPALGYGTRIVFPHIWRGRVNYFSTRELEWREESLFSRPDKDAEGNKQAKNYNLPRSLAGERQRYYTFRFTRGAEICLVIEGQFDALSAAQLGVASVALVGVVPDEQMSSQFKKNKIRRVFVGLDNDEAGVKNSFAAAAVFGPMTRLVKWEASPAAESNEETETSDKIAEPNNNEAADGSNAEE